jgi:hypothetical protein
MIGWQTRLDAASQTDPGWIRNSQPEIALPQAEIRAEAE